MKRRGGGGKFIPGFLGFGWGRRRSTRVNAGELFKTVLKGCGLSGIGLGAAGLKGMDWVFGFWIGLVFWV